MSAPDPIEHAAGPQHHLPPDFLRGDPPAVLCGKCGEPWPCQPPGCRH